MKTLYTWASRQVHHPFSPVIFTALVCLEAFLFMPTSTLLMAFGLEDRKRTWLFATLAVIGSVVGAAAAYFLGLCLWDTVGKYLVQATMSPESFDKLIGYYRQYQIPAVFLTAFFPLPYKVITLTAGFCGLPFVPFLVCCGVARALRFYALAAAIMHWGDLLQQILDRYFYYLVALGVGILIISGWLIH